MPWQYEAAEQEALRSANIALSGRKHREVTRLASIELRSSDPRTSPWEAAAIVSVGFLSVLVVVGCWFL
jgi:hypothetical protein